MGAKIKNLDAYMARLKRVPEAARTAVGAALAQNASELAGAIARACDDDPKLSASVGFTAGQAPAGTLGGGSDDVSQVLAAEGLSFTVYAGDASFPAAARWREFGTHPHAEDAKDGGVMAFEGKEGQGFAAHVQNPGERAQPFFFPTYRAYKKRMNSRASRAGSAAIKKAFAE